MARKDLRRAIAYAGETGDMVAQCAASDALREVARLALGRKAKPAVEVRAARTILEAAGLLPRRRR